MQNRAIIFMSHGYLAQETLKSAEMIVGATNQTYVVSMTAEDGLSGTNEKLTACLAEIGHEQEVLVIADLKGGTPCNVAMMKMQDYPKLRVITGLNLALAIEAVMSPLDSVDALVDYLVPVGKDAIDAVELPSVEDDEEYED